MIDGQCKIASGLRSLNCAAQEKTSKLAPEAPGGVRSARFLMPIPNLPTKGDGECVGGASRG
eukprot:13909989-Alexandrium_andersonii.AAC.1